MSLWVFKMESKRTVRVKVVPELLLLNIYLLLLEERLSSNLIIEDVPKNQFQACEVLLLVERFLSALDLLQLEEAV